MSTTTTKSKMSNATARKHFLHDCDEHGDSGQRCCYFSQRRYDEEGWGFWVRPDGTVDVDDVSANGELPASSTVDACRRAAVKYLRN